MPRLNAGVYPLEILSKIVNPMISPKEDPVHCHVSAFENKIQLMVKINSWRYLNFLSHGFACVCCGRKASYLRLEVTISKKIYSEQLLSDEILSQIRGWHFNAYSEDNVLMTKDHIFPKSLGGRDCLDNFQTMCTNCNSKKGSETDISVEEAVEKGIAKYKTLKI